MIGRRETLGAAVAVATAGCGSSRTEAVADGSETLSLDPGQFQTILFSREESLRLDYEVRVEEDRPVDVFLMDSAEYGFFQQGIEYQPIDAGTTTGTADDTVSVGLEPDVEYHLVADNSSRGPTDADGPVTVRLDWQLVR